MECWGSKKWNDEWENLKWNHDVQKKINWYEDKNKFVEWLNKMLRFKKLKWREWKHSQLWIPKNEMLK